MTALRNPYLSVPLAAMAVLAYVALRPDVQTLMLGCIGLLVFVTGCLWAAVRDLEERYRAMNEDLTRLQKLAWRGPVYVARPSRQPLPTDHGQNIDDMARTMAGEHDWEKGL